MNRIAKLFLLAIAALAIAGIAVIIKRSHLESGFVSAGKTEVNLNVTVRGTGGRAVKNARISLFDPEQVGLGSTNEEGLLTQKILVSSGRSLLLQAEGMAFKMQRVLLIPRSANYSATVFFDLAEVHEGNATLLSTENSESTGLVKVSTPVPVVVALELKNSKISDEAKAALEKTINAAALKRGLKAGSHINCTTWDSMPVIHECELASSPGSAVFRLFQKFPQSEQSAESWLQEFEVADEQNQFSEPSRDDLVFNIRHNGRGFKAYLDNKPLKLWKEKSNSSLFRVDSSKIWADERGEIELTIFTEDKQVLQRKISTNNKNKYHIVRIPSDNNLELSRRDGGSSIAR